MQELLHIAIMASIEAGIEILKVYETDFIIETKNDKSPLTVADKNANDVINKYLLPTNINIISEENNQDEYNVRRHWESCWVVDPLDGTKEFIKKNGEFTVNIALVKNGTPIMGVIYVPVVKTLYFTAVDGKKSFKTIIVNNNISITEILSEANEIKPSKIFNKIRVVGSRSHLNEATRNYIDQLPENEDVEIVSKGSSLKFCLIAEGVADVYPRFAPTMEWDTAAGQAICQAVGAKVIDQTTQKALQYNKENLLNPYFLVSNFDGDI